MARQIAALFLLLSSLAGQSFWAWNFRTHPELEWQVLSTEHFNVFYHQGLEEVARRGATIAEQVYQPIMDQLNLNDFGKTDMILSAEDEIVNGFALPANQIFIWVYQNDAAGWFTGSEKWLKAVIAHEFQHVVLMNALRTWLGVVNLLLVPSWFVEGTAEYYTEKWRVGRSDNVLKVHTYMNTMKRLDPHDAGYAKVLYLADKYGDSTITKLVHYRDEVKVGERRVAHYPYSFKRAFKKVTGQSLSHFEEEWRRAMNTYYYSLRGQKESVDEVGEPLAIPQLTAIRGLAISPDSSRVAVVARTDKYMRDWGLYTIRTDSTHRRIELHYGLFSGHPAWSPDGRFVAISEYHRGSHGSLVWDIRLIDAETRKARWLTRNARALDPVWSPDGKYILFAAHPGETTNLYLTDPSGEHITRLTTFAGDIQIQDPQWSPDGKRIVFTIQEEDGNVDVALAGSDGTAFRKVTDDPHEDLAPLWSADGQWIIFTSFRNSTPNLYRVPASGGEVVPLTDVSEGIYTAQIVPRSGEVAAMTLTDVDTVRIRRLPTDRSVEPAGQPIVRETFTRWRQGQPEVPIPVVDHSDVPAMEGPLRYRSWGSWRPVMRLVIPDFYGVGAFGMWQDALGKNLLLLVGEVGYTDGSWGGLASWTNARFAPFLNLTAYRDFRFRIRGYGSGYLLEELSGLELSARFPFNFGNTLTSNHILTLSVRGDHREPVEGFPVDETSLLGPPDDVHEGGLGVTYTWKSQRPDRRMPFLPPGGAGFRIRYRLHSSNIYGEYDYDRVDLDGFVHRRIPRTPLVMFTHLVGTRLAGTPPCQDRIGLLTDPPVTLNPGSALGLLVDYLDTPQLHSLRGLAESVLGDMVISGTAEFRLPLIDKSLVQVMGLGLGQFTAAIFTDFGLVWPSGKLGTGILRQTYGMEIRGNIVLGDLTLLTLAGGQAGGQESWRHGRVLNYWRLGLVSPF